MTAFLTTNEPALAKTAAICKKQLPISRGQAQPQSRQPVGSVGLVSLVRQIR